MSQPSFVLRLTRPDQSTKEFEFAAARITLGREVGDIPLLDPGTSSKHAEVHFTDGLVVYRDVGSTNGSWLGSERVTETTMAPGKAIQLGGSRLELLAVKGVDAPVRTMVMPGPRGAGTAPAGTLVQPRPALPASNPPAANPPAANPPGPSSPPPAGQPTRPKPVALVAGGIAVAALGVWFALRSGSAPAGGTGTNPTPGGKATVATSGPATADQAGTIPLTTTREATVKAVWFKGPAGPQASGGTSSTTVRIAPNPSQTASVGVLEEFAGGAGNQWRTATWVAAFSSAQLAGQNLTDYEFLVRTGGHIDGPSAGMLMTSTMLALLRGKTVRADTTMTGTINPDGSAGPVGGIVQKMDGASKDGIKRFGFPMGARNHQDLRTGRTVDLFDTGKEFGLAVREIRDVFEAYEFLTGDKLVRPQPVAESEMELDGDTSARLRSKNEKWKARLDSEIANIGSFARGLGDNSQYIQPIAQQADAAFKKAQEYERSDFLGAAYESFVQAAVLAGMTKDAARFLKSANDLDDMIQQVRAAASMKGQLTALLNEAELRAKRKTGGGQINTLRAYQAAVTADAFAGQGDNAASMADQLLEARKQRDLSQDEFGKLAELMFQAITYYSIAKTMLDVAEDQKDFGNEEGQSPPIAPEVIGKFASAYGSAAGAVLQYLESLTIEPNAQRDGIDKASAQARFAANEQDYLFASRAVSIAEGISGKQKEMTLLRLAAGSMAFLKGASLVNKYYSLGGENDAKGNLTLTNRKALSAQLDLGRELAREAAAKAKQAVGFVPIASRLAYQLGVAKREGNSDEDKLAALEAYWESAFWSELAANSPAAPK
jgi:predicted S18 family serine protease